ncbi:MAG: hypothetical protein K0R50_4022 [Eubacterium sp.]|nr:hypothetical protein [Eubacterium sp.]
MRHNCFIAIDDNVVLAENSRIKMWKLLLNYTQILKTPIYLKYIGVVMAT